MPERLVSYQVVNHQQDSGVSLTAPSLERLFIDGALALTDFLVQLDRVQAVETHQVKVAGANRDELMAKWIGEILTLFEKDKFLSRRIVFTKFDGRLIEATLYGEKFDAIRHGGSPRLRSLVPRSFVISDSGQDVPEFSVRMLFGESKVA